MKLLRVLRISLAGLVSAAVMVLVGCDKGAATPPPSAPASAPASDIDPVYHHLLHAQPTLPTIKVWVGDQELKTEIASRPTEIATGMMFRTNTPEDQAM